MILATEIIMALFNLELASQIPHVFRFTVRGSSMSINLMVSTLKETSYPIEDVF